MQSQGANNKDPQMELILKLYNRREELAQWFRSELGTLVVQYLSNNKEEALAFLLRVELSPYNLGYNQGIVQGIEQFLELEYALQRFKLTQDIYEERVARIPKAEDVFQAVSEGKTHF